MTAAASASSSAEAAAAVEAKPASGRQQSDDQVHQAVMKSGASASSRQSRFSEAATATATTTTTSSSNSSFAFTGIGWDAVQAASSAAATTASGSGSNVIPSSPAVSEGLTDACGDFLSSVASGGLGGKAVAGSDATAGGSGTGDVACSSAVASAALPCSSRPIPLNPGTPPDTGVRRRATTHPASAADATAEGSRPSVRNTGFQAASQQRPPQPRAWLIRPFTATLKLALQQQQQSRVQPAQPTSGVAEAVPPPLIQQQRRAQPARLAAGAPAAATRRQQEQQQPSGQLARPTAGATTSATQRQQHAQVQPARPGAAATGPASTRRQQQEPRTQPARPNSGVALEPWTPPPDQQLRAQLARPAAGAPGSTSQGQQQQQQVQPARCAAAAAGAGLQRQLQPQASAAAAKAASTGRSGPLRSMVVVKGLRGAGGHCSAGVRGFEALLTAGSGGASPGESSHCELPASQGAAGPPQSSQPLRSIPAAAAAAAAASQPAGNEDDPTLAAQQSSLLSLPSVLLQHILLSTPGGPGRQGGAICASRALRDAWIQDLSEPRVIATHLRMHHSTDAKAALCRVYSRPGLSRVLLPPQEPQHDTARAAVLLQLALRLQHGAGPVGQAGGVRGALRLLRNARDVPSVAPLAAVGGVAADPEAAAVLQRAAGAVLRTVAAAKGDGDGAAVRGVLQLLPWCCAEPRLGELLWEAADGDNVEVARALLDAGADAGQRAWGLANMVRGGRGRVALLLLQRGAGRDIVSVRELLDAACGRDEEEIARTLLLGQHPAPLLERNVGTLGRACKRAAANGAMRVLPLLHQALVALPCYQKQQAMDEALVSAVEAQQVEAARLLVAWGAAPGMLLDGFQGDNIVWRLLLSAGFGAEVLVPYGERLLSAAVQYDQPALLGAVLAALGGSLLSPQAQARRQSSLDSALEVAAKGWKVAAARSLLDAGALIGRALATSAGNAISMAGVLLAAGAKRETVLAYGSVSTGLRSLQDYGIALLEAVLRRQHAPLQALLSVLPLCGEAQSTQQAKQAILDGALWFAATTNAVEAAGALLAAGAAPKDLVRRLASASMVGPLGVLVAVGATTWGKLPALLAVGCGPEALAACCYLPLSAAARSNQVTFLKGLLAALEGGPVSQQAYDRRQHSMDAALREAADGGLAGHVAAARSLLEAGATVGTALGDRAADEYIFKRAIVLLAAGAERQSVLQHGRVSQVLREVKDCTPALLTVVRRGIPSVLRALLSVVPLFGQPQHDGLAAALQKAVKLKDVGSVRTLVAAGASPCLVLEHVSRAGDEAGLWGLRVLRAAECPREVLLPLLGPHLNAAACSQNAVLLPALLNQLVTPATAQQQAMLAEALVRAVSAGGVDTVKLLLAAGASPDKLLRRLAAAGKVRQLNLMVAAGVVVSSDMWERAAEKDPLRRVHWQQ